MTRFTIVAGLIVLALCQVACKAREADAMKENGDREREPATGTVKKVIDSPVAGSWYTSDGQALRLEIQGYLDEVDLSSAPRVPGRVAGLISPHAGYRFSGKVEAHGYSLLKDRRVRRVIVLGPSHHVGLDGFALTRASHWRTPLGEMPLDPEGAGKLAESDLFDYRENAFTREHSIDIQVPFIQVVAPDARILPVVVGQVGLDKAREAGKAIRALLDDETVVVASSDFTHYGDSFGYVPFREDVEEGLKKLTDQAAEAIVNMDAEAFSEHVESTGDTICGRAPIMTLLSAVPRQATAVPLKFDTSGRMTGDWSHTVSYLSVALFMGENRGEFQGIEVLSGDEKRRLLDLARDTLKRHLAGRPLPDPEKEWKTIPDNLKKEFGVFVTLKNDGNLRGCIGSILPVEPLYQGVIRNAVNASTRDTRFVPMNAADEPHVDIEISVLTPPETVMGPEDILVGRDGIILEQGPHRAVFLPQVAPEQGWDLETTLTRLSMKAGLSADAWRSGTRFKTFQAHVFHEEDGELVH